MSIQRSMDWSVALYRRHAMLLLLLAGGVGTRLLVWHHFNLLRPARGGEGSNVAIAFAQSGTLADAYFAGQGPTAHVMPIPPILAGTVYAVTGVDSRWSAVVLGSWTIFLIVAGYALLYRVVADRPADRRVALAGIALLCLIPLQWRTEVEEFRFWEGPLTVIATAANFLLMHYWVRRSTDGLSHVLAIGGAVAVSVLVQPIAGVATAVCWGVLLWRDWRRAWRAGVAIGLLVALALLPWTIRNERSLGAWIPTRSNFGLEVALANYPGATRYGEAAAAGRFRWHARIHPYVSEPARARIRAIGEVAYSREWGDVAFAWARDHPWAYLRLSAVHWVQYFAPPRWSMHGGDPSWVRTMAAILIPLVNLLGLAALAIGSIRGDRRAGILLLFVVLLSIPYALVQPVPRYTYPAYVLLAFPAVALLMRLASWRRAALPGGRRAGRDG